MNLKLRRPLLGILGAVAAIGTAFALTSLTSQRVDSVNATDNIPTIVSGTDFDSNKTYYLGYMDGTEFYGMASYTNNWGLMSNNPSDWMEFTVTSSGTGFSAVGDGAKSGTWHLGVNSGDTKPFGDTGLTQTFYIKDHKLFGKEDCSGRYLAKSSKQSSSVLATYVKGYSYGLRCYTSGTAAYFYEYAEAADPESVEISAKTNSVYVGQKLQLNYSVLPGGAEATLVWDSLSPEIASVDAETGLVTALAEGEATITATVLENESITDTFVLNVRHSGFLDTFILPEHLSEDYSLDYETMELQNGVTLGYVNFSSSNYQGYDEISLYKGYYIENLDAPAHIKAIEFESLPVSSFAAPIVTVGNTLSENTTRTISEYSTEDGVLDQRFRYEISELGDYDYFRIEAQGDRALYVASIRIEYEYEGSESAYSFSKTFLEGLICDPTGTSAPDAEEWELLGLYYEDVDEAGKNLLKEAVGDENGTILEQCVARYDYVVGKYGSETYSDFIGRSPERPLALSAGLNGGLTVEDTATWTCAAILFAAALTAGSAFIIKRRREGR